MIRAILVQMFRKRNGCVFKIVRESDGRLLSYAKDFNAAHMIAEIEKWDIGQNVYDEYFQKVRRVKR